MRPAPLPLQTQLALIRGLLHEEKGAIELESDRAFAKMLVWAVLVGLTFCSSAIYGLWQWLRAVPPGVID